jgi:hypothetical protein
MIYVEEHIEKWLHIANVQGNFTVIDFDLRLHNG